MKRSGKTVPYLLAMKNFSIWSIDYGDPSPLMAIRFTLHTQTSKAIFYQAKDVFDCYPSGIQYQYAGCVT